MQVKVAEPYAEPDFKIVTVEVGRLCQTSPFGNPGEAGAAGIFSEESESF